MRPIPFPSSNAHVGSPRLDDSPKAKRFLRKVRKLPAGVYIDLEE
jgi:hypothetical protein